MNFNSRSPLSETGTSFVGVFFPHFVSDVGEITQGSFVVILVLHPVFCATLNWGHLARVTIYTGLGDVLASPTPILYIYSLGHFLTTKGALIDGDAYPPKTPKKGSKNGQKLIKFRSKKQSKKCVFNGKIDFFTTFD